MDDSQLQGFVAGLQGLADRLALESRYTDGALVAGAIQAIRALRTKLEPPQETRPPLELVAESPP